MLDTTGVSTATACKVLRELLLALAKGWPGLSESNYKYTTLTEKEKNYEQSSYHRLRRRSQCSHSQMLPGQLRYFTELCIASRTKAKCDALAEKLKGKTKTVTTAQVDADNVDAADRTDQCYKPDLVMNIALPYQDLTIMDACLACGVNYMDTANYEPENTDDPEWRAIYEKRCKKQAFPPTLITAGSGHTQKSLKEAGLTALLGCGFDPGVTQAYCAYAKSTNSIRSIPLIFWTATAAITVMRLRQTLIRKSTCARYLLPAAYWENGHWVEIPPMNIKRANTTSIRSARRTCICCTMRKLSLLQKHPGRKTYPFLHDLRPELSDHMRCLEDVGMLSTTPIQLQRTGNRADPVSQSFCRTPPALARAPRARPTSAASSPAKRTEKKRLLHL